MQKDHDTELVVELLKALKEAFETIGKLNEELRKTREATPVYQHRWYPPYYWPSYSPYFTWTSTGANATSTFTSLLAKYEGSSGSEA